MTLHIKRIQSDIEAINKFNATPGSGVTRPTFSKEYQGATDYVVEELKKIGAAISICPAGNIRGRLSGSQKDAPAIMMGSHLDTVAHGGQFDGVVGVVTALEAARRIVEDKATHRLPVDVVIFPEEEGSRFGRGLLGSSIWTGILDPDRLNSIKDANGMTYLDAMTQAGLSVNDDCKLKATDIAAMLEVHIEQGAVLEKRGHRIGLVEAIAGIQQLNITIKGTADHAGTTPMMDRSDPLQGAARIIIEVDKIARRTGPHTVATVGRIICEPAQVNVIPGLVRFSVDIRDSDKKLLDSAVAEIQQAVQNICNERQLGVEFVGMSESEPVVLSAGIINLLEEKTREKDITPFRMISGAGHDTALVAELTKAGMIFVPSRDGLSHCPREYSRIEDIALACEILLETVVELAA
ncbi:MAG: Zn-dependent hydrolase [bacterium]|nr:Zn-dependent hydrolase [bacterium]